MGSSILYIPKKVDQIFYPEYGALYNLYAIIGVDDLSLTSSGFHIATNTEWQIMATYLGGQSVAGTKLRESGFIYWVDSIITIEGTNAVGFNGRGAGTRSDSNGLYYSLGSSTRWAVGNTNDDYDVSRNTNMLAKAENIGYNLGISVRGIKDSTVLAHGETGTYRGNDGRVYRTICIGTQEWIADNLAETKLRDGSIIPWYGATKANYFTGAEWIALETAGVCAYDNDENNVAAGFTFPDY